MAHTSSRSLLASPTAAIVHDNGMLWIYRGCADTCVGLATASLADIIAFTKDNSF